MNTHLRGVVPDSGVLVRRPYRLLSSTTPTLAIGIERGPTASGTRVERQRELTGKVDHGSVPSRRYESFDQPECVLHKWG